MQYLSLTRLAEDEADNQLDKLGRLLSAGKEEEARALLPDVTDAVAVTQCPDRAQRLVTYRAVLAQRGGVE